MEAGCVSLSECVCLEDVVFSSGAQFPNSLFPNSSFPYDERSYGWNQDGTGLRYKHFPFPIFLVEEAMAGHIVNSADQNRKQVWIPGRFVFDHFLYSIRVTLVLCFMLRLTCPWMQPTIQLIA